MNGGFGKGGFGCWDLVWIVEDYLILMSINVCLGWKCFFRDCDDLSFVGVIGNYEWENNWFVFLGNLVYGFEVFSCC